MLGRRRFLAGLAAAIAAPAIVRASNLMPVKVMTPMASDPLTVYVDPLLDLRAPGFYCGIRPFRTIQEAIDFVEKSGARESAINLCSGVHTARASARLLMPRGEHRLIARSNAVVEIRDVEIVSRNERLPAIYAETNSVLELNNCRLELTKLAVSSGAMVFKDLG